MRKINKPLWMPSRGVMAVVMFVLVFFVCMTQVVMLQAQVLDKTVAVVNLHKTENVSKARLDRQYTFWAQQTGAEPSIDDKKEILEATINDVLIMQAAAKDRIVATKKQVDDIIALRKQETGIPMSDQDFRKLMEQQSGLPWSLIRQQIQDRIVQEQYIARKYGDELKDYEPPTQEQIEATYNEYATRFTNPAMVRISHLYFDTTAQSGKSDEEQQKKAYELAAQINNNGKLFDEILEESVNKPDYQGSDLGYVVRDARTKSVLGDDFLNKVFAMKKGATSGVIKSNSGYHIVKLTDKRDPKLLTLKDPILPGESITVEDRIRQLLIGQNQQLKFVDLVQREVDELRKQASIKYFLKNL